jgi:tetraacyldisaccharide 4'-kinase
MLIPVFRVQWMSVMTIHEVWYGKSIAAKVIRIGLLPLSWLYTLGWQIYLLSYKLGFKSPYRATCKVICIGNFSAGGTGKTPTVVFVAKCLRELGVPFAIGCSGYGAPHSVGASIAPEGTLNATEWGDEPSEIRELLPDVPLIVGRARVRAAKLCEENFPGSVLLMDDGFQHMPLAKDVSVVLDPETSNSFTFPAGPYREPRRSGAKRADLVIPSSKFTHVFSELILCAPDGSPIPLPKSARVITAIGRPEKFRLAIEATGVAVTEFIALPDHDKLEVNLAEKGRELPWIVTQKDWVKLRLQNNPAEVTIIVAKRTATIEPVDEFKKWLKIKLG